MKKRRLWLIASVCILFLAAAALLLSGKKPFRGLTAAEITFASVRLIPPDKTVAIDDLPQLVSCLQNIVTYRRDDSYTEYSGQGVIFTFDMADGTQTEVMAYSPFVVINGVSYRTKHEPCAALASFANSLLAQPNARFLWSEPPALSVLCGNSSIGASLGAYSWQHQEADGTSAEITSHSLHPLDSGRTEFMPVLDTEEPSASLQFQQAPDSLRVHCWNAQYIGNTSAASEPVSLTGIQLPLKPGDYIYEVAADWNTSDAYSGAVRYSFRINASL